MFYSLLVLIIGTYDKNGRPDAMNAAYGGLYTSGMVEFSISHDHKTFKNIQQTHAFTISFADAANMAACDYARFRQSLKKTQTFAYAADLLQFPI